jgi:hypothetical protein
MIIKKIIFIIRVIRLLGLLTRAVKYVYKDVCIYVCFANIAIIFSRAYELSLVSLPAGDEEAKEGDGGSHERCTLQLASL